MKKDYTVERDTVIEFNNNVDFCVGTGRMGLALQKEYMDQLKAVQEDIGFKYIRGHGLFADDMAIYQEYKDWEDGKKVKVEYNFTYLDLVMDGYMAVNIRPFLELGFMPSKLGSGEQTIFYWRGNTTPPKSYDAWCDLVTATLKHLMDRYGADEVVTWPIEVWNEPNLPGFWKDANMEEYLVLFERTFNAIKALDPRFRIGGPAICGVEDKKHMTFFMEFLKRKNIKIDFITRHHYTSEAPEFRGHYAYIELRELNESFETLNDSRNIIDSYPEYKGIDMHITEFNTSYVANAPIHDTNKNAAYVASMLEKFPETSASYSYWTFGDIFEEIGVPHTLFHGGFGMMADRGIRKPTYYAFKFFKEIKKADGKCILKNENSVVYKGSDGCYRGVIFNSRVKRTGEALDISFTLPADADKYSLIYRLVDEKTCNPYKVWHDLGEPSSPNAETIELLKNSDKPAISSAIIEAADGNIKLERCLDEFGLAYFELKPYNLTADRGFDYARATDNE